MARIWVEELGKYLYDEEWERYRDAKLAVEYMKHNAKKAEEEAEKARKKAESEAYQAELERSRVEKENKRRDELRKHCRRHGLDYDTENRKYVKKMKTRATIGGLVLLLSFILACISLYVILFVIQNIVTWNTVIFAAVVLLVFVIGACILPDVPNGFYDQIK